MMIIGGLIHMYVLAIIIIRMEWITIPIIRAQFGHIADSIIIGMIHMFMIHFIFPIQDIMDPITVIGMEIIIITGIQTITMITTRKRREIGNVVELNQVENQLYVHLPRIQKPLRML